MPMRFRDPFVALLAVMALVVGATAPAMAQDAAADSVPFIDAEGNQLGTVTIREFSDPFTDFDPGRPPGEDQRYAMLTVTFEAADDRAFNADPYQVQLRDAAGNIYTQTTLPRTADAVMPDLAAQALAPFDRISGVIGFVLPAGATVSDVLYRGDGSRLLSISQPAPVAAVAVGEARPFSDAAGTPLGTITVREAMDPYVGHEPTQPPAEGQRYVLLDIAFEALEDQAMATNPNAVNLLAADGSLIRPGFVPRPQGEKLQNLEGQPLSPADRVSGAVGFVVPADMVIDGVVYVPDSWRILQLVDL
jgi:hypothetical protein